MPAGHLQGDPTAPGGSREEERLSHTGVRTLADAIVRRGRGPVPHDPPGAEAARAGIVGARDEGARDLPGELPECLVVLGFRREDVHVVVIDVRDDRDLRPEREEGAVVLVRLDHQGAIAARVRVRAEIA